MKKALILAAGIGKRLGNLTNDIPKCLLPIDSSKVLLDFTLETLKEINIHEVVFVTGYKEEKLREHIKRNWGKDFSFQFIFNEKFSEYNNVYSAYLAKDIWDDETILLNSDIIFHPNILKTQNSKLETQNSKLETRKSFLTIDDKKPLTLESMKVKIDNEGRIKKINKSLDIKTSFGEYIGITYLRGFERVKFLESLEKNVKNKRLDIYYEDALADVLNEVSIFPCFTKNLPWTEVDTEEDYNFAKEIACEIKRLTHDPDKCTL